LKTRAPKRQPSRQKPRVLKVISLFTGVGGLDFGFEAAGFKTAVAVELDPIACQTIRLNRDWPVLQGPIQGFSTREILKAGRLRVGEADVLVGGPPCQPFSKAGYWHRGDVRRLDDPRAETLSHYLRVMREAKPKTFLLENVPGLAFDSKNEGFKYLIDGIAAINRDIGTRYRIFHRILNAADFGVPQIRERIFLVGSRDGKDFSFPEPTFRSPDDFRIDLPVYRTAWDAIGDLASQDSEASLAVGGKWGPLLPTIPEGSNYLWHTSRGGGSEMFGWRTRYWSFLLKLAKNRPAWTIQAQPGPAIGPFHWRNRRLSSLELSRLQTFPDGISFQCSRSDIQRLVGNAVPSLLAETLALEIRAQLLGIRRRSKTLRLLPPSRGHCPEAEPTIALPEQYHPLIGEHAAHPGTGKGKRAVKRNLSREDLFVSAEQSKAA
jgi:DNA (cytosine-5)-methyltransferase 1